MGIVTTYTRRSGASHTTVHAHRSLCGTTIKTKFVGALLETSHDAWWEDTLRPRPTNRISKSTSQMFKSSGMSLQKRYASSCAQLLVLLFIMRPDDTPPSSPL